MLLSARLLADVANVNNFRTVNQIEARAGSTIPVYFQLIDASADRGNTPSGRRFVPASNSTLSVAIKSVYPHKQLVFPATNPFPEDRSIWKFTIQPSDGKVAPVSAGGPIIDWSNLVPIGEPFDFNVAITDFGMVGTFGLIFTLTENPGYSAAAALSAVVAGDQVVINGVAFTAVVSGATGTQFDVGGTDAITATNLAAVINTNSSVAQVTATATGATVTIVAVRAASITWTATPAFTLSTPSLSPNAVVTTGWVGQAVSIAPSMPMV